MLMTIEAALRLVAGTFLLLSLALAHFVSPNWLWFTAFIGLNLVQSAFTGWCPMMAILRRAGLKPCRHEAL
jgi:Inner membrane protein YgaP-like, transmembrane domain